MTLQRQQREYQKALVKISKTTFFYISLQSLHDYYVNWPNFRRLIDDVNIRLQISLILFKLG